MQARATHQPAPRSSAAPATRVRAATRSDRDVRVEVAEDRRYPVRIRARGFDGLGSLLDRVGVGERVVLLSDRRVARLYGGAVRRELEGAGREVLAIRVPSGEREKTLATCERIYDRLVAARVDRTDVILTLGGGVIGDLGGFVAATYLRGIRFLQVPTTLLAQVDASVGGKTGVNHPGGKNLIGAFHQPVGVYANMETLRTLSDREYRSGLAEVVKYGIIRDPLLFQTLEERVDDVREREPELMGRIVRRCVQIKADVVAEDEREAGPRAILNLGHTLGHALELIEGYGHLAHGEAVAIGTAAAARLSAERGWLGAADRDRIVQLLSDLGLPVAVDGIPVAALVGAIGRDKKVRGREVRFVAPTALGETAFRMISVKELARDLARAARP